ncbi:MAG: tRNA lysidine(34) synthetase TilS [Proteobacteria bacterium]|nr:tRNA lysidine(34) synthetase TilS [Pseudomonadota bacterium]
MRAASNASSPTDATATRRSAEAGRVAVAYSGGRDSTALLHAVLLAAAGTRIEVLALHVHHGLSPNADAWTAHCAVMCRRWAEQGHAVRLHVHRVSGRPPRGASIEAWARDARYAALRAMAVAQSAPVVMLAHHRRDQAETWLLQALRGAGVAGLSAMPREIVRGGITWLRPWLDRPRAAIEAYVRHHELAHIEDDSNDDPRYARNRLRLQVWPALIDAFPQAEAKLADAAAYAQQAAAAMAEWIASDLAAISGGDALRVAAWSALSPARRAHGLRAWLAACIGKAPPAALVRRLLDELPAACSGARWATGRVEWLLHRGLLRPVRAAAAHASEAPRETTLSIRRAGVRRLPGWGGRLDVVKVEEGGVPLAWLGHLELRERAGAEQFQAGLGRPPRSLKKQYQAAGIAASERTGPLIYSGGQLVYVPGLGLDARVIGMPGQPLVRLEWSEAGAQRR